MASSTTVLRDALQQTLKNPSGITDAARRSMIDSAHAVIAALETPEETVTRLWYASLTSIGATETLIDLGIFKALSAAGKPQTTSELAKASNADPILVSRLLKHLATEHFVDEVDTDTYKANKVTDVLAAPGASGLIKDMNTYARLVAELPKFLKKTSYANPTDRTASLFCHTFNTSEHYFQWLMKPGNEHHAQYFHDHMSLKRLGARWFQDDNVIKGIFTQKTADNEVLLVDIGGNVGGDLSAFSAARPELTGRLVLEELEAVIANADTAELTKHRIEPVVHDMFTPQPIVGAQVYFAKNVLHDWPDADCVRMLTQLKPALKKGYSKILLNEIILPDTGAHHFETSLDLIMMAAHSAQERRESDWKRLVGEVGGLRVKKLWPVQGAIERIIEIELE